MESRFHSFGLGVRSALSLKGCPERRDGRPPWGYECLIKEGGIELEQLYKALSKNGNPRLAALSEVLHAVSLRVVWVRMRGFKGFSKMPFFFSAVISL